MGGIYRQHNPEKTVLYRVLFPLARSDRMKTSRCALGKSLFYFVLSFQQLLEAFGDILFKDSSS